MAKTSVVEIERKYDVKDKAVLPPLQKLPGVRRVDPPVEHTLEAEYFDTDDMRLASEGITLRRRTGGDDTGWHLKLPSGPDERQEHRQPPGQDAAGIPEALLSLVRVHTRDKTLASIARVRTQRTVHRLRGKKDGVMAEVSADRVEAETPNADQSNTRWREWEIELVGGDPASSTPGTGSWRPPV
jgi:inorganic triphosphatase YgiF